MMKYLRYYITPILAPTVIIGIFLGGHWMWLGLVVLFVVVIGGMPSWVKMPLYPNTTIHGS